MQKITSKKPLAVFAALFLIGFCLTAYATDYYWDAADGDWNVGTNWTPNGVPLASEDDYAYIDNGGTAQIYTDTNSYRVYAGYNSSGTVNFNGGISDIGHMWVGYNNGSNGTVNIFDGELDAGIYIGNNNGSSGTVNMFGGEINTSLYLGYSTGSNGIFNMYSGIADISTLFLGSATGATGTCNLDGGALESNYSYIGWNGTGIFNQTGGYNDTTFMSLGYKSAASGTYNLSAGTVTTDFLYIGRDGSGQFNQTGGNNTALYLYMTDSSGYTLEGGTLSINYAIQASGAFACNGGNGTINLNNGGIANFSHSTLSGTSLTSYVAAANTVSIFPTGFDPTTEFGYYSNAGLAYNTGDTIVIPSTYSLSNTHCAIWDFVSVQGFFKLDNLAGGFEVSDEGSIQTEYAEVDNGQTGSVTSSTATLTVNKDMYVGRSGVGTVNQSNGMLKIYYGGLPHNLVEGHVYLGYESGSNGTYNLTGGALESRCIYVGYDGQGEFNMSGGSVYTMHDLIIGHNTAMGDAVVTQTGGDMAINGNMYIGRDYTNSGPLDPIEDGTGSGIYNMSGGTLVISNNMYIGGTTSEDAQGRLFLSGGQIEVAISLVVTNAASYIDDSATTDTPTTINIWGGFFNHSTANTDFEMRHTTLEMYGGDNYDDACLLNMNSTDYGATMSGLVDNFAIGHLVFSGSTVESLWYKLESDIYCYALTIEVGAVIDLNGYNIYYLPGSITSYGGVAVQTGVVTTLDGECQDMEGLGGMLIPLQEVPEPATIALLGAGVLTLAGVVRKNRRKHSTTRQ